MRALALLALAFLQASCSPTVNTAGTGQRQLLSVFAVQEWLSICYSGSPVIQESFEEPLPSLQTHSEIAVDQSMKSVDALDCSYSLLLDLPFTITTVGSPEIEFLGPDSFTYLLDRKSGLMAQIESTGPDGMILAAEPLTGCRFVVLGVDQGLPAISVYDLVAGTRKVFVVRNVKAKVKGEDAVCKEYLLRRYNGAVPVVRKK